MARVQGKFFAITLFHYPATLPGQLLPLLLPLSLVLLLFLGVDGGAEETSRGI